VTVRRFDVNASTTVLAGVLRNSLEGFSEIGILKRGTGTLTLSGNNTYDGATQIENGTLVLGDGGASGTAGAGDIELLAVTARLGFNRSDSLTVDNLISGSGSVVQLGSGTTDLTVANTYTGGTTIQNGILKVSNLTGSGTGSGTVTVKSGGRLSGTGIITGNITIETDGILAPGSSFGTLSGVNLSLQDGAKLQWELSGNATEYGNGQYDKLVLSGGLEADDKAEFDFLGTGYWSGSPTVYTLIQFAGTTTVNAETFTIRENSLAPGLSSGGFAVVYNNDLDMNELQLTVIPEPASLGLLGAVAVAAILRRRIR
jgi:fibronectin-binding autotransporter adhesin